MGKFSNFNRRKALRAGSGVTLAFTLSLLAAACGSSSSTSSSASTTSGSTATTAGGNLSGLKAKLQALEAAPTFTAPGPPLNGASLKGSHMEVIDCASNAPPPANTTAGVMAAAKAAGINMTELSGNSGNIPQEIQFLDQAIAAKPKAIITVGCISQLLTQPLTAAKAAGIPVVVGDNQGPTVGAPGQGGGPLVFGIAEQAMEQEGMVVGEYIAAHGPADAQVGVLTANEVAGSPQVVDGLKAGLAKYCPKCTIAATSNVDPGNWASQLSSTTSSMLLSHPNLNYLMPVFDGMASFVYQALTSSGKVGKVKVVNTQGSAGPALTAVSTGTFAMDVGSSNTWVGWVGLDQAMRGALGMQPETNPIVPFRLFTKKLLANIDPKSDASAYGTDYAQGFLKLWGLG